MSIQNTKITLIQEDLHQLLIAFNKLSNIVCPIFTKINIMSEWTTQFILQDKKVMYTGDAGIWTQILFKN
jgi:hypothetical protein